MSENKPLSPDAICDLHRLILLEDDAESGAFRKDITVGSYMKLVRVIY